jgi:uncharacterized protein (TIGR03000 family)
MYSVILMTAMTTGAPETPQFFGCFRAQHSCSGCSGCTGCSGGCQGWHLGWRLGCGGGSCSGCCGCSGAYSSGSGGSYMNPPTPGFMRMAPADWGANYTYSDSRPFVAPKTPGVRFNNVSEPKKDEKKDGLEENARLMIEVPSNAKVYVDGSLTKSGSEVRQFYTPALERGQSYFYDVKVEVEKDGKLLTANKRIYVKAGDVIRASLNPENSTGGIAKK